MKLIVGLGNPGSKYHMTRHNIGFMVMDEVIKDYNGSYKLESKFKGELFSFTHLGEKVFFLKPATYVNLSGESILLIMNYYNIPLEDILIFVDDINLPNGKIRMRELGGHGGHNGLRNIISRLNTEDFKRVRVGVDFNDSMKMDSYVLGKPSESEMVELNQAIKISLDIIKDFIENMPYKDIMTKYNTKE